MDKRGLVNFGKNAFILLVLIAFLFLVFPQKASAEKSDQYFSGNFTCEQIEDTVLWSAIASKTIDKDTWFNWSAGTSCNSSITTLGPKNCDIVSIYSFVRYLSIGSKDPITAGMAYAQVANTTQSLAVGNANGTRYVAYLNQSVAAAESLGPRYECGIATQTASSNRTCSTNNSGFNESNFNYTLHLFANTEGGGGGVIAGIDIFNARYDWCWTPMIYDATVSLESGTYQDEFNFTINVTNPSANTTVYLWTRPVGGTWVQEGSSKSCANCSQGELGFLVSDFAETDIGNREFKFNATDDSGFDQTAGNPSTLGTATNECLDSGNDCVFTLTDIAAAQGTPTISNETVNGQTSDAAEGWGTNWTFSVNVSNPADGTGDINLTLRLNTGAGFADKESRICSNPCSTPTNFTFFVDDFLCADISSAQYQFRAINTNGTSTATQSFTIEKDDINIEHVQGNNTIANRSGNQEDLLILRVFDTDKAPSGEYIGSGTNVTFSIETNGVTFDSGTINQTNSTGHTNYYFNPVCTPTKYQVGNQDWKGDVLSSATCYKPVTLTSGLNLSVRGDIILDFNTPDGSINFTQEDLITFLGSTVDDCGTDSDALVTTTRYNANISASDGFACTNTTKIGANAFQCVYTTDITTSEGYYNTTMFANASFHYDNFTQKTGFPGLFYIFPVKKLENPRGNSSLGLGSSTNGWGNPNWNFTITASSGDANNVYQVDLLMSQSVNPTAPGGICNATQGGCLNQTSIICDNCISQDVTYYRNFTNSQQGGWFFRFALNDSETITSGTDFSVIVEKDDTNISYGGNGNATTVTYLTQPQNLSVRVFDIDKNSFNVTVPSANVTFKLLDAGYGGGEKVIGYASTNETGHARLLI